MKVTEFKLHYKDCFPVGEGWRPLVGKLVDDIIAINPEIEITQIKEKFGLLRIYISGGNDAVYDLIDKAEAESSKICERCGTRENVSTKGGWLLTLCDECRNRRDK